jgi:hypothetical protein
MRTMIEYFRFHIEYLWNAAHREPPFESLGIERQGRTIDLKKTGPHAAQPPALRERFIKQSIFNSQFQLVRLRH